MSKVIRKFEFYEECASQWYDRLNDKDKGQMRQLTGDLMNKPHQFLDVYTRKEYQIRVQTLAKFNALIPEESLYTLDNHIARVFYDACPSIAMLAPVTSVNVGKAHESKVYTGTDFGTAKLVGAHGSWSDPPMIGMSLTPEYIKALGVHAAYQLGFNEVDEAGLYDIEWFHALKCGEKVATLHDQKLCLGENAEDAEIDTTLINGYYNYGSAQTVFFGSGDNVITTSGDFYLGLLQALGKMKAVKEPGDIILVTTAGVHAEQLLLRDALDVPDMDWVKKTFFDTGYIKEWWVNENLDPTTTMLITTQRAMLLKRGVTTAKREVVYPLQSKMMATEFPDDIKTMIMIMDIYKMYNTNAAVVASGAVTTATLGFVENGRVL